MAAKGAGSRTGKGVTPRRKTMSGKISTGGTKGSIMRGGKKAVARQTLRKQTRKALNRGMPVKASNKGLGISKNEGTPKVRKAIKTLGYSTSEKVVQRTKKRMK